MRKPLFVLFVAASIVLADRPAPVAPAPEADATKALEAFEKAFDAKAIEEKQSAVYALRDVPNDRVLARLASLLSKDKRPEIRNVAALAVGGQRHNVVKSGELLLRTMKADFKTEDVVASALQSMAELRYLDYWPQIQECLWDERAALVIRSLEVLGANQDWRATEQLVKMFKERTDEGYAWKTGSETVDTGAEGNADQEAAEAAVAARARRAKASAAGKAEKGRELDFTRPLRKAAKSITGQDFESGLDFEDYYIENYVEIARKIAAMNQTDPDSAAKKAAEELPALKAKVAAEREEMARRAEEHRKRREEAEARERE